MKGVFITFEGNEGSGKTTQVQRLAKCLAGEGYRVRQLREPGGTPIGEEIRHTLKHSSRNRFMTAETELLLMNASRAQLVREIIRPALADGEVVVCDRFYDSTLAYQGYGRQLELTRVQPIIDFAVEDTRPDLTLWLALPLELSRSRSRARSSPEPRDRMEEADRSFFERVEQGYEALAQADPVRIKRIDASGSIERVGEAIWAEVSLLLALGR
jgi:dTMP kinase